MTMYEGSQGGFFIQQDEDDVFSLLTCTGVGDVELPFGDLTPVYCPSLSYVGEWEIDGAVEGVPGFVTYSLNRPLRATQNYLVEELANCFTNGKILWRSKLTSPDDPNNFALDLTLLRFKPSGATVTGPPVAGDPDENERVATNADLVAFKHYFVNPLTHTQITVAEPSAINNIAFDLSAQCDDYEAGGDLVGKEGYFTCDAPAGSPALFGDVYYTTDYGATWTKCPAQPFAAAENAGAVVTRGGTVIVARLTADAGNPAEVAISSDYGATWSNVNVGSVNNQTITSMWWLDYSHLWAAATGGYVYFSSDGGQTWTAQTSGGVTAQDLRGICAYDRDNVWAVGAAAAIIYTTDGTNWQTATGPAGITDGFNTVFVRNPNRIFIGSDGAVSGTATMYVSEDQGANWTAKGSPTWASGEVEKIHGVITDTYRYFPFVVGNTSGPVGESYRSRDGGASFQEIDGMPTNVGINDLFVIDQNTAFAVGEATGGTGFVVKMHRVS